MKLKVPTLVILFLVVYSVAHTQISISKQKDVGADKSEYLGCIYQTKDGGLIVAGFSDSDSSYDKTQPNIKEDDFWVVKLDKKWNKQWDKTFGGLRFDYLNCVIQTNDGGYLLGGTSNSFISGTKTDSLRGDRDYYIVKIDSAGNQQWDKAIGGNDYDALWSMQQTSDGGFILGGASSSGRSGDKTQRSVGGSDYWIIKLDSAHNITWDETIGGDQDDQLFSVQQTSDGGYILGGYSSSNISGQKSENSKGIVDYWIVKLNSAGKILWDKTYGGSNYDWFRSLGQTSDSGYVLVGNSISNSSGDKTENSKGFDDYWVIKINAKGKIQWDKTIGSDGSDMPCTIKQTINGGYIIGGYSTGSISGDKTEFDRGQEDFWIVKLSKRHQIEWDKTIGGDNRDWASCLLETSKDNYVIGGYTISGKSFDKTDTLKTSTFSDYWIVNFAYKKPAPILSKQNVENDYSVNNTFNISPNPAKDLINIHVAKATTILLLNSEGKILIRKNIAGDDKLDVSGIASGIYFLKNTSTGEIRQVLVQK